MPQLTIPTLRNERLRLEPLSPTHSAGMFTLWSRAEVCRYSGPAVDAFGDPVQLPAVTPLDSDRILDFFVRRAAAGLGLAATGEVVEGAVRYLARLRGACGTV